MSDDDPRSTGQTPQTDAPPTPPEAPAAPDPDQPEPHSPHLLQVEPPIVPAKSSTLWRRVRHVLQVVIPLLILWFLWEELTDFNLAELRRQIATADLRLLLLSGLVAMVAVLATGLYDVLAFPHTPRQGATRRWGLGAIFFSWTNFVALGPVGVPFLRLHWYGKAGMSTSDVIRGVGRLYVGMSVGLAAWAIAALIPLPTDLGLGGTWARALFAILLSPILAGIIHWLRLRLRRNDRAPTPVRTMLLLGLVGGLDWGAVLLSFVLAARAVGIVEPTAELMGVFFIGHIVGLVSMVPGGLGTADATWLLQLSRAGVLTGMAAAHIMLFRITFYIVPWLISVLAIGIAVALHHAGFNGKRSAVAPPHSRKP